MTEREGHDKEPNPLLSLDRVMIANTLPLLKQINEKAQGA